MFRLYCPLGYGIEQDPHPPRSHVRAPRLEGGAIHIPRSSILTPSTRVDHVEATCEILLNGYLVGTVLTDRTQIDVTSAVGPRHQRFGDRSSEYARQSLPSSPIPLFAHAETGRGDRWGEVLGVEGMSSYSL